MMISRPMLLTAALLLASTTGVFAQVDHAAGAPGGAVANPPPYPPRAVEQGTPPRKNPYVPGATGRTIVPGTNSTIAGDSSMTVREKTGTVATGSSGGGGR